jgi:hypothetical protein
MKIRQLLKYSVSALAFVMLSACGGGGQPGAANGSGAGSPGGASGTYTPAGNAGTVEGVDSEHRGYRDDVAQLIADKYSAVPGVKAAAAVAARSYQSSITATTLNSGDTTAAIKQAAVDSWCATQAAGAANAADVVSAIHGVYARTFNTDARMAARQQFLAQAKPVGVISFDSATCAQGGAQ